MSDQPCPSNETLSPSGLLRVDEVCDSFEDAWKAGQRPQIEDYLNDVPETERSLLVRELLVVELQYRRRSGETLAVEDYLGRFPEHADLIQAVFAEQTARTPSNASASSVHEASTGPKAAGGEVEQPVRLGRYRITGPLGKGGFGVVYRGYDDELRREVAIKVPHRQRVSQPQDVEAYLTEARVLASLDHPHIVPVFDVGRTGDGLCFVVSKFIEGSDLKAKIKDARPSVTESAELVATVAEALQYAHEQRLVHRDLKPANILLDRRNTPYLTDFGLALREEDFGKGGRLLGTPAYMSPEQANGEGHLVDGRSDIFSLGVVFYELLTGRRPFVASDNLELLRLISTAEVRPPRQLDVTIPKELERICLKALAKRASERYTTAFDLADDVNHWLAQNQCELADVTAPEPCAPLQPVKIVPKGLRAFDAHDADFFLELLPGPRDREGLPDSIRFWKNRIIESDAEGTFRVGLIYGPSGSGKSSLVKAGLLPTLPDHVIAVYIEATPEETESRLSKALRKRFPELPPDQSLIERIATLRRGRGIASGSKLLIVLDQFEQWLHAKRAEPNTELVQALRQCDGERVQCLVMVRDDFWMAATRFTQTLEIDLVPGQNLAAVDLFDLLHARKVLSEFGRAYGRLPDNLGQLSTDQHAFLEQAVAGLAEDGRVICVRLALFAEMVKGKPWTPATLKEVGGMEGVGRVFLEETFGSSTAANPRHRLHQKAAQAVLKPLLPETGTAIKGNMRSREELLAASGYPNRPKEFQDLLRILDSDLRLITPTDPEGAESDAPAGPIVAGGRYYQLTHDYLVPSLREWLTGRQRETRRGRAELRLAERAALWDSKPQSRHLPAWWEWLNIRLFTRTRDWTQSQRKMMRQATRYYGLRGLLLVAGFVIAILIGLNIRDRVNERSNAKYATGLVHRLLDAETAQVPAIVSEMENYRLWTDPSLREEYANAAVGSRQKLHTSLALLPVDSNQKEYLCGRLLNADPHEVAIIRDALIPHQQALLDKLWNAVEQPAEGPEGRRLRAACALATYDPDNQRWAMVQDRIANDLVSVPPVYLERWMKTLRPVRAKLVRPLSGILRDAQREPTERALATNILADYAADQPGVLADLLMDAHEKQFAVLFPRLKEHGDRGLAVLQAEVDKKLPPDAKNDAKEKLAKRQANAAVALLRLNVPDKVWPLLQHRPDPRVRSYLIHRFSALGADAGALVKRLDEEPDVTIRRALILSLGEYSAEAWPAGERSVLVAKMQELYRTADDSGLHAAAEWFLRQPSWQQAEWLRQTNEAWAKDKQMQEKRLEKIKQILAREKAKATAQWYVDGQGQTMVVIPGPVEFVMGSPPTEEGRHATESQHRKRIGRTFALAATPVTKEQFLRCFPKFGHSEMRRYPDPSCPIGGVVWYEAAAYCNWLSQQEHLPKDQWCYETNPQGQVVKLKEKYLRLTGYRLPTEAEWEYVCRAGAVTSRHYGESEELLRHYGWYRQNSAERTWPVGSKKPNEWGLFDLHGNVWTWCQDKHKNYPQGQEKVYDDIEDILSINKEDSRVWRGGSFFHPAGNVRSALRAWYVPTNRDLDVGFRAARTLTTE